MLRLCILFLICLAQPLWADMDRLVANNTRATLYHEFAHALVDIMDLKLFGQEEDAADTLAAYMVVKYHTPDEISDMMHDVSADYEANYKDMIRHKDSFYHAGEHGHYLQRKYNFICIVAGSDVQAYGDLAMELGLGDHRLDLCASEFAMARYSWGNVLRDLTRNRANWTDHDVKFIVRDGADGAVITPMARDFTDFVNETFVIPAQLIVRVEPCGEENAFYQHGKKRVIIACTEYTSGVRRLQDLAGQKER